MNDPTGLGAASGGLYILLVLLLILLVVLWILLPFAVFGLKARADNLIAEQKKTNAWLEQIAIQQNQEENSAPNNEGERGGRHISFE